MIGAGGYMGAMTFGFVQRAGSLYEKGIARQCRCIGATAGTAVALNTQLSSHFILAQADESFIALTNLESVESIAKNLQGYHGVIVGDAMAVQQRPITAGTYETGPNDKTYEVFWDTLRTNTMLPETQPIVQRILGNVLEACQAAKIQHIVGVATTGGCPDFTTQLQSCGIPSTVLQCYGTLINQKDYTYRKGIQSNLQVSLSSSTASFDGTRSSTTLYREDIAALTVSCLQNLEWNQRRILTVQSKGPLVLNSSSSSSSSSSPSKRPDQEWCVNSHVLTGTLLSLEETSTSVY